MLTFNTSITNYNRPGETFGLRSYSRPVGEIQDFTEIKANFVTLQNTGGIGQNTGDTGDYKIWCQAWYKNAYRSS